MTLQAAIRKIVNDNSGGVKVTALATYLVEMIHTNQIEPKIEGGFVSDKILEDAIASMSDVKLLNYSWHMAKGYIREKGFVYTP